MDSSHSDVMPQNTAIDGEADSSKSEQLIVMIADVSVSNMNETSPCVGIHPHHVGSRVQGKDLDLCSSPDSKDAMSAVLFYIALVSYYSLLVWYVWASKVTLWTKVPVTIIWIWGIAPTLPITDGGKWPEENQKFTIDMILHSLCTQALLSCFCVVALKQSLPFGFCRVFGISLICSVLCRLSFDSDNVSSSSTNRASPYGIHGHSSSIERDSEHEESNLKTSIIGLDLKSPSWPSSFEMALIYHFLLMTAMAWALTVSRDITWLVPTFFLTIFVWYLGVQMLPCVYNVEVDWGYESKKRMTSRFKTMAGYSLISCMMANHVPENPVFMSIFIFLDFFCLLYSFRVDLKLHKD